MPACYIEMNLAGRLVEETPGITAIAPNITPEGRVSGWTDSEFARAIRQGIKPRAGVLASFDKLILGEEAQWFGAKPLLSQGKGPPNFDDPLKQLTRYYFQECRLGGAALSKLAVPTSSQIRTWLLTPPELGASHTVLQAT